jgi:hypothetical protein
MAKPMPARSSILLLAAYLGSAPFQVWAEPVCSVSCDPLAPSRCAGTGACLCAISPKWATAVPVVWELLEPGVEGIPFADLEAAVNAASDAWSNASCSRLRLAYGGPFSASPAYTALSPTDQNNRIVWISSGWAWGSATPAVTHAAFDPLTNLISDVDIELNAQDFAWSLDDAPGALDIQSVLLHELGHLWGAVDSSDIDSAMSRAYLAGPRRALSADDQAQLCCLYPAEVSGAQGEPCETSDQCQEEMVCAQPEGSAKSVCAAPCTPGMDECPAGLWCAPAYSVEDDAACFPSTSLPPDLCGFCDSGAQCSTGQCIVSPLSYGFCSSTCLTSPQCGTGLVCASLQSGSTACVPSSPTGVCPAPQCDLDRPCPDGYHCEAKGMCRGGGPDESCRLQKYFSCDSSGDAGYRCIDEGTEMRCRKYCTDQTECAEGLTCLPLSGTPLKVCAVAVTPDAGTQGAMIGSCEACGAGACEEGYDCFSTPTSVASTCHKDCSSDSDCPQESSCAWISSGTGDRWCACPKEIAGRGESCSNGRPCDQRDVCVLSPEAVCRKRCAQPADCPGEECVPLTGGDRACLPRESMDAGEPHDSGYPIEMRDGGLRPDVGSSELDSGTGLAPSDSGASASAPAGACGCGPSGRSSGPVLFVLAAAALLNRRIAAFREEGSRT